MRGAGRDAMGAYARVQIPAYAGMTAGTPGMTGVWCWNGVRCENDVGTLGVGGIGGGHDDVGISGLEPAMPREAREPQN